jgi:hypothetical protein
MDGGHPLQHVTGGAGLVLTGPAGELEGRTWGGTGRRKTNERARRRQRGGGGISRIGGHATRWRRRQQPRETGGPVLRHRGATGSAGGIAERCVPPPARSDGRAPGANCWFTFLVALCSWRDGRHDAIAYLSRLSAAWEQRRHRSWWHEAGLAFF